MRSARLAVGSVVTSLLVAPLTQVVPGAAAVPGDASVASTATAGSPATPAATLARARKPVGGERRFEPALGAAFNDPMKYGSHRLIVSKIIKSIQNTAKDEKVRIATWNFDDRPATDALIAAKRRGVTVQVIVSGAVHNENYSRLARVLNRNKEDQNFAMRCTGGCRSRVKIMHSKFYLFSRVHKAHHLTMIGSSNLTTAAGNRQWNDLVTMGSKRIYDFMGGIFDEYAKDKSLRSPYEAKAIGSRKIWIYPVGDRNPQLGQLKKVRCRGATGGTGVNGRTKIRVAVAGWFDSYGEDVAKRLRHLWDQGCDVRVVTTLAGRGVNRALGAAYGRGPVPQRELAWDRNFDGLPDRYLHQKSVAISGVFGGDTSASVVLTGSPNWSARAARSEEVWMRVLEHKRFTRRYLDRVDRLYFSPVSSARSTTRAELRRAIAVRARAVGGTSGKVATPDWLELD